MHQVGVKTRLARSRDLSLGIVVFLVNLSSLLAYSMIMFNVSIIEIIVYKFMINFTIFKVNFNST